MQNYTCLIGENMTNQTIPDDELDKPMGQEKKPLPLLPELTMLDAQITDVKLDYATFQGKPQYVQDFDTKENILDENGQPIPRKEFNITFSLSGYSLPNNDPRKCWLKLGASMGEKSKLAKFVKVLNINLINPSPRALMQVLMGRQVRFQLINKEGKDGNTYQNINFDSIRPIEETKTFEAKKADEIVW